MPKGGPQPGSGRKTGSLNRASLEAALAAAQEQLRVLTARNETGRKLAIDVLDDVMHLALGLAGKYQPLGHNQAPAPGADPSEEKFRHYLNVVTDTASKLATFQSPKFKSIAIAVDPTLNAAAVAAGVPLSGPAFEQLTPAQAYRIMRDSDTIDLTPMPANVVPIRKAKKPAPKVPRAKKAAKA